MHLARQKQSKQKKKTKKEKREEVKEQVKEASIRPIQQVIGNKGPKVAAAVGIAIALRKHAVPLFDTILSGSLFGVKPEDIAKDYREYLLDPGGYVVDEVVQELFPEAPSYKDIVTSYFTPPHLLFGDKLEREKAKVVKGKELLEFFMEGVEGAQEKIAARSREIDTAAERNIATIIRKADIEDGLIAFGVAWWLLSFAEERTMFETAEAIDIF